MNRKLFPIITGIVVVIACITECMPHAKYSGQLSFSQTNNISHTSKTCTQLLENGHCDSALVYFSYIESISKSRLSDADRQKCAKALSEGAVAFCKHGLYPQALRLLLASQNAAEESRDSLTLTRNFHLLGLICSLYGDNTNATKYTSDAFAMARATSNEEMALKAMSNIIIYTFTEQRTPKAKEVEAFRSMRIRNRTHGNFVDALLNANIEFNKGQYRRSMAFLDTASRYTNGTWDSKRAYAIIQSMRIPVLAKSKQRDEAIRIAKQLLSDKLTRNDNDVKSSCYKLLYNLYKDQRQADSTIFYFTLYQQISDSVFSAKNYGLLNNIKSAYELNQAATDFRIVNTQRNATLLMLGIAVAALAIIAAMLVVVTRQKRKLLAQNKELYHNYINANKTEEAELKRLRRYSDIISSPNGNEQDQQHHANNDVSQEQLIVIADKISSMMSRTEEIFNNDFCIDTLAKIIGQPKRFVSQAINDVLGKNFSTLLGETRVREACRRLTDTTGKYANYTIEAIALSVGFKSRTNFVSVFKNVTKLTPSEYKKAALTDNKRKDGIQE